MRETRLSLGWGLLVLFVIAGCGDEKNIQWIEAIGSSCPGKEWDEIKKDKDGQVQVGKFMCGARGKVYAGEYRCKDRGVQIKCG